MNAILRMNHVHTQNVMISQIINQEKCKSGRDVLDENRLWKMEHMMWILVREKKPGVGQQENEGIKACHSKTITPITEGGAGT
jgi:hypothetical protein